MFNYKSIIRSRRIRFMILRLLSWVPDKTMIKIQYYLKLGRLPDLRDPKTYCEKIQLYKLNYRPAVLTQCVDKIAVREFVKERVGDKYLIPLIKVVTRPEEINLSLLPEQFVMKSNNGSGTVLVCGDKSTYTESQIQKIADEYVRQFPRAGREWAYYNVEPKILFEELIGDSSGSLVDYKFFCFDGVIDSVLLCKDRVSDDDVIKGFFTPDLKFIDVDSDTFSFANELKPGEGVVKPNGWDEMIEIVKTLANGFPHVRVDLYNINGTIYFGELTFYSGSGYRDYGVLNHRWGNMFYFSKCF